MTELTLEHFVTPYTAKRAGFGWWDVVFEDTRILNVWGKSDADQLVAALNGAYNLGRSFELIRQTVREIDDGQPTA